MSDGTEDVAALVKRLAIVTPDVVGGVPFIILDSVAALAAAIETLTVLALKHGGIAVDLEGVRLGRTGTIAPLQLCAEPRGTTYIVDVSTLGSAAFDDAARLRGLLESSDIKKLFWDVRSDANALFYHFDVAIPPRAVVDLQLLELASATARGRNMPRLSGLGWLLDNTSHGGLSDDETLRMHDIKDAARRMFAPELGGSYAVWHERPLSPTLLEYATDCRYFHAIRDSLSSGLMRNPHIDAALTDAMQRRIELAHSDAFRSDDREANVRVDSTLVEAVRGRVPGGAYTRRGRNRY